MSLHPTSHHLPLRQFSIHYLAWTPPDTPPLSTLVMLHGFGDSAGTWAEVAAPLALLGHRVIAPDLRGFGESDWVGAGGYYHFPDYLADLDELTRALHLEKISLVGHSMGGTVAALFAGSRPALIEALALLEGLGPPDNDPVYAPDRVTRWLDDLRAGGRDRQKTMSREEAFERLRRQHGAIDAATLARVLPRLLKETAPGQFQWHFDPLHRTTSPTPFFASSYRAFAARVACPTLLLHGGADGFHPADEAERVAAFRHATEREIAGAGHMMHWTRPAEVAAALGSFLATVRRW